MARQVNFAMRGNVELRETLEDVARRMPARAGAALEKEAKHQLGLARERTPFESGELAASGVSSSWGKDGHDIVAKYGFGGRSGSVPYAMAQHMNPYQHDKGERFWLRLTARSQRGRMTRRIARDLEILPPLKARRGRR